MVELPVRVEITQGPVALQALAQEPPQSIPVSFPFFIPSVQVGLTTKLSQALPMHPPRPVHKEVL